MIRTVWFYLMLVVSSFVHAATVIVAALVGGKRRPGGRGIYDWGTNDWARDLLDAAGAPGRGGGVARLPPRAGEGRGGEEGRSQGVPDHLKKIRVTLHEDVYR